MVYEFNCTGAGGGITTGDALTSSLNSLVFNNEIDHIETNSTYINFVTDSGNNYCIYGPGNYYIKIYFKKKCIRLVGKYNNSGTAYNQDVVTSNNYILLDSNSSIDHSGQDGRCIFALTNVKATFDCPPCVWVDFTKDDLKNGILTHTSITSGSNVWNKALTEEERASLEETLGCTISTTTSEVGLGFSGSNNPTGWCICDRDPTPTQGVTEPITFTFPADVDRIKVKSHTAAYKIVDGHTISQKDVTEINKGYLYGSTYRAKISNSVTKKIGDYTTASPKIGHFEGDDIINKTNSPNMADYKDVYQEYDVPRYNINGKAIRGIGYKDSSSGSYFDSDKGLHAGVDTFNSDKAKFFNFTENTKYPYLIGTNEIGDDYGQYSISYNQEDGSYKIGKDYDFSQPLRTFKIGENDVLIHYSAGPGEGSLSKGIAIRQEPGGQPIAPSNDYSGFNGTLNMPLGRLSSPEASYGVLDYYSAALTWTSDTSIEATVTCPNPKGEIITPENTNDDSNNLQVNGSESTTSVYGSIISTGENKNCTINLNHVLNLYKSSSNSGGSSSGGQILVGGVQNYGPSTIANLYISIALNNFKSIKTINYSADDLITLNNTAEGGASVGGFTQYFNATDVHSGCACRGYNDNGSVIQNYTWIALCGDLTTKFNGLLDGDKFYSILGQKGSGEKEAIESNLYQEGDFGSTEYSAAMNSEVEILTDTVYRVNHPNPGASVNGGKNIWGKVGGGAPNFQGGYPPGTTEDLGPQYNFYIKAARTRTGYTGGNYHLWAYVGLKPKSKARARHGIVVGTNDFIFYKDQGI